MPRSSPLTFVINCIRAARVIRGTGSASASKVARYLDISYSSACELLAPLSAAGILQLADHVGFRKLNKDLRARAFLFIFAVGGRARRRRFEPDWQKMDSYDDVASAAASCLWLDVDAFIGGPFNRLLELAIDPRLSPRAAARIVEFAREVLVRQCLAKGLYDEEALLLEKAARNMALARLGEHPVGTYLLTVFSGRIGHNTHPANV